MCAGCDGNELKAWARPAVAEPPPISSGTRDGDDDGLIDVQSDADSDEREEDIGARRAATEKPHSGRATADV